MNYLISFVWAFYADYPDQGTRDGTFVALNPISRGSRQRWTVAQCISLGDCSHKHNSALNLSEIISPLITPHWLSLRLQPLVWAAFQQRTESANYGKGKEKKNPQRHNHHPRGQIPRGPISVFTRTSWAGGTLLTAMHVSAVCLLIWPKLKSPSTQPGECSRSKLSTLRKKKCNSWGSANCLLENDGITRTL